MRTYSVTQGTQCGRADRNGKEFQKRGEIHINIELIHFAIQEKLTQHCKATIL